MVGGLNSAGLAIELLLGDQVVHSATGTSSNEFSYQSIDLQPWREKELRIRLVDKATGGWGSIGIDRIVLTDDAGPAQPLDNLRDNGSMALAILAPNATAQPARGKTGNHAVSPLSQVQEMAVRAPLVIPAKGEIKTTVLVS